MNNTCICCNFSNHKLSKREKGVNLTWCRKHKQHVSPIDFCEYFKNEGAEKMTNYRVVNAENAIRTFLECLVIERKDKTTRKPISRALYRTWRYYDSIEKERGK